MTALTWTPGEFEYRIQAETEGDMYRVRVSKDFSYQVRRVEITWRYGRGDDRDSVPAPFVILRAAEIQGNGVVSHRTGRLYAEQLREVPEWLDWIIEASRPPQLTH